MWNIIESTVKRGNKTSRPHTTKHETLEDWERRKKIQYKDKPDCIKQVDGIYSHEGVEPTKSETLDSIKEIADRASKAGSSDDFVK